MADLEMSFFYFFKIPPLRWFFKNALNTPPLVKSQNRLQGGGVFKANSMVWAYSPMVSLCIARNHQLEFGVWMFFQLVFKAYFILSDCIRHYDSKPWNRMVFCHERFYIRDGVWKHFLPWKHVISETLNLWRDGLQCQQFAHTVELADTFIRM